jgi:hypothetical protein
VLPLLRNKIFHVTSADKLNLIEKQGIIKPNAAGLLGLTFSQSAYSYGRRRGYVCLFDLRNKSKETIEHALDGFYFLAPRPLGDTIAFLILSPAVESELITDQQAYAEIGYKEMYVPNVECWYPCALPLSQIEEIILVEIEGEQDADSP